MHSISAIRVVSMFLSISVFTEVSKYSFNLEYGLEDSASINHSTKLYLYSTSKCFTSD